MNEEKKRILGMLADGKLTADQAEMLIDSLGPDDAAPAPVRSPSADWPTGPSAGGTPRFLYVKVLSTDGDNVDVKIPLTLLRAGLKLTSLIPPKAMDQINESMGEGGMGFDFNNLKPEEIEEIVDNLGEMEINVNSKDGDNVRVFCA
ncbi:MAG: hypothetical protein Q7W30_11005 [Coriobacteriia bacterium]|nr:hypothetical protein [Coriobacteriia bacterium]